MGDNAPMKTSYSFSPVVAVAASRDGSLPGYESRCSCGLVIRSSLATMLAADCAAHATWHERRAAA